MLIEPVNSGSSMGNLVISCAIIRDVNSASSFVNSACRVVSYVAVGNIDFGMKHLKRFLMSKKGKGSPYPYTSCMIHSSGL